MVLWCSCRSCSKSSISSSINRVSNNFLQCWVRCKYVHARLLLTIQTSNKDKQCSHACKNSRSLETTAAVKWACILSRASNTNCSWLSLYSVTIWYEKERNSERKRGGGGREREFWKWSIYIDCIIYGTVHPYSIISTSLQFQGSVTPVKNLPLKKVKS